MSRHEMELQRQLDDAERRIAALERREPIVHITLDAPAARNVLQSISDWWHGGSSANDRVWHERAIH